MNQRWGNISIMWCVLPAENRELVEQAKLVDPTVKKTLRLICLRPVTCFECCHAPMDYRTF